MKSEDRERLKKVEALRLYCIENLKLERKYSNNDRLAGKRYLIEALQAFMTCVSKIPDGLSYREWELEVNRFLCRKEVLGLYPPLSKREFESMELFDASVYYDARQEAYRFRFDICGEHYASVSEDTMQKLLYKDGRKEIVAKFCLR